YYVVAHFHYVLFGGAILGLFGGIYYWFPKVTGRLLDERLGKWHFWGAFIGFNLTFGPMHILGLQGQVRRTYTYPEGMGWDLWNAVATAGAFLIAASVLVFIVNIRRSLKSGEQSSDDPWDARTLEWATASPPPVYNFAKIPTVSAVDDFWHRKYTRDDQGRLVRIPSGGSDGGGHVRTGERPDTHVASGDGGDGRDPGPGGGGDGIHMPSPSYFPALASIGFPLVGFGAIYGWWWGAIGAVILVAGVFGWACEPLAEEEHA
ncbi:MAG: cbb3-type cytochrome c oxidase subunit I, partial [Acidimicrobiia bacterium]